MVEVNMIHMIFQTSASSMASKDSSPPDTLHNRMELLNERAGPSWTWSIACFHTRSYHMSIGLKILNAQSIFSIDHPRWVSRTRFLKNPRVALRLVLHIYEFSVMLPLFMSLMNSKETWIRRVSGAFSLVTINNTRVTSCIILSPKILCWVEMWSSLKKNAGVILHPYKNKKVHICYIYLSDFQDWKYTDKKKHQKTNHPSVKKLEF